MALRCIDWREADADRMAALYDAEALRWSNGLGWDTRAAWREVDRGRELGTVLGRLAIDRDGTCAGWTFGIVHRGAVQVGGLVAASAGAARALIDSLIQSPAAARATSVSLFAWPNLHGIEAVLRDRQLSIEAYDYLDAPLTTEGFDPAPSTSGAVSSVQSREGDAGACLRPWRASDIDLTLGLLRSAYAGADASRPFAPGGTLAEWRGYLAGLVGTASCGVVMRDASLVATDVDGRTMGLVFVTRLSETTAHVAQLVVAPSVHGRGVGRRLLDAVKLLTRGSGCERVTLLVARRNAAAQRLYARSGFRPRAMFLSATSV